MPDVAAVPEMLDVTITAHQPLALGVRPAGTAPTQTLSHVPGSVLRGALATVWIRDHGLPMEVSPRLREEFIALFEGEVRYGPLFASASGIVPLSVKRCKYRCSPDAYLDTAFAVGDEAEHCDMCGQAAPLERGRGEVGFFGSRTGQPYRQRTHLEIDDDRQVAKDKALFTRRALSHRDADGAHRTFHGRIVPGGSLPETAASWLAQPRKLRMGGGRSTGGGVSLASAVALPELPETAPTVVLRLLSPAALTCSSGLPLDIGDRDAVRDALNDELADLLGTPIAEVSRVWARREHVGGWHAASALPKSTELALSPGSVVRLEFTEPPAPEGLRALTARGIGLRRNEGFGAVETAVTDWRAPVVTEPDEARTGQAAGPDVAEKHARALHRTQHGKWFLDHLRPYVTSRLAGEPPNIAVLGRTQLRALPDSDRDEIERMLIDASPEVLDRTLAALRVLTMLDEEERQA